MVSLRSCVRARATPRHCGPGLVGVVVRGNSDALAISQVRRDATPRWDYRQLVRSS